MTSIIMRIKLIEEYLPRVLAEMVMIYDNNDCIGEELVGIIDLNVRVYFHCDFLVIGDELFITSSSAARTCIVYNRYNYEYLRYWQFDYDISRTIVVNKNILALSWNGLYMYDINGKIVESQYNIENDGEMVDIQIYKNEIYILRHINNTYSLSICRNSNLQIEMIIGNLDDIRQFRILEKEIILYNGYGKICIFDRKQNKIKEINIGKYITNNYVSNKMDLRSNNIFIGDNYGKEDNIIMFDRDGNFIRKIKCNFENNRKRYPIGINIIGDELFVLRNSKVKIFKLKY